MDFHTIETGEFRILECQCEFLQQLGYFFSPDLPGGAGTHEGELAIGIVSEYIGLTRFLVSHAPWCLSIRHKRSVRHSTDMPDLQKNPASTSMDFSCHQLPTIDLGLC